MLGLATPALLILQITGRGVPMFGQTRPAWRAGGGFTAMADEADSSHAGRQQLISTLKRLNVPPLSTMQPRLGAAHQHVPAQLQRRHARAPRLTQIHAEAVRSALVLPGPSLCPCWWCASAQSERIDVATRRVKLPPGPAGRQYGRPVPGTACCTAVGSPLPTITHCLTTSSLLSTPMDRSAHPPRAPGAGVLP